MGDPPPGILSVTPLGPGDRRLFVSVRLFINAQTLSIYKFTTVYISVSAGGKNNVRIFSLILEYKN